eukprot:s689_g25.t1
MKIAVLGCGAMGSIYAAFLSEHHEVTAIDVWHEHVQAINSVGLRVEESTGKVWTVKMTAIAATAAHSHLGQFDLAIIATKASNVAEAARTAAAILKDDGLVLSIQNGLNCTEVLEQLDRRVFLGVASSFGACMKAPGHAFYEHLGRILIGAMKATDSQSLDSLDLIVQACKEAGLLAEAVDDIQQVIWRKLINNCANGACSICGTTVGEMMANEHLCQVAMACAREVSEIAQAKGILAPDFDVDEHVTSFNEKVAGAKPSMLQDLLAGRPCEINGLNGAIAAQAAQVGLSAPVNATVANLVRALERPLKRRRE